MDFQERLNRAIDRGHQRGSERAQEEAQRALTEKELQRLHSQVRLELCERIEHCLADVVDRFPGFRTESIVDDRGWGAAISREDIRLKRDQPRQTSFSRLEFIVARLSPSMIIDVSAKGTVANREVFRRSHFQRLAEVDMHAFTELLDLWVLEYAERFAAEG